MSGPPQAPLQVQSTLKIPQNRFVGDCSSSVGRTIGTVGTVGRSVGTVGRGSVGTGPEFKHAPGGLEPAVGPWTITPGLGLVPWACYYSYYYSYPNYCYS